MTEVIVFLIVFTAFVLAIGVIGLSIAFTVICKQRTKEVKELNAGQRFIEKES